MRLQWRKIGLPLGIAFILLGTGIKIWQQNAGDLIVGAFMGSGFVILGMAVYELFHVKDEEERHDLR